MPRADVDIDVDLVHALLAEQHEDLAELPLTPLANGWDNVMMRLGEGLVVRLPRREVAARLVRHEQEWLPVLAPRLPLRVPVPVRLGIPGCGYPWAWSVIPYLPGKNAVQAGAHDDGVAESIGRFLGRLHRAALPEAPANPFRGVPLSERVGAFEKNVALVDAVHADAVRRAWEASLAAPPWTGQPVWLHGDLHPANILIDAGRASAVIDFGDLTSGDPATDLSVAWMLQPEGDHRRFWAAYRDTAAHVVDDALVARARGWALVLALVFLGSSPDDSLMATIGRATLTGVLS